MQATSVVSLMAIAVTVRIVEAAPDRETKPYSHARLVVGGGGGYEDGAYVVGEARAELVLGTMSQVEGPWWATPTHVAVSLRGGTGTGHYLSGSLLLGIGLEIVPLMEYTILGGVDVDLWPGDVSAGPIVTAQTRVGRLGIAISVWRHVTGDDDIGGMLLVQGVLGVPGTPD